ncbi:T4SS-associated protein LvhB7 [Legionella lytica]|uniref:T4SS-associated protein LvhB7 n=1 Tax=Legionella lytica TaxID=96232 RepID=A0ABW8D595_9GAMM
MTMKWMFSALLLSLLTGCSSTPPDLDAPCTQFGRYCPQYPINEASLQESK